MRALKLCLIAAVCLAAAPSGLSAVVTTYISGPNSCSTAPGYADMPYCTIPGEIPLGGFPVPPAGGTYLDPNFGGLIRILTGPPFVHVYSQASPFSAHNRYIGILHKDNGRATILNAETGSIVADGLPFSDAWVWDAYNDDIHYRIDGTRILKTVISSGKEAQLIDYSHTSQHFSSISSGGSADTSKDNWLAFWAGQEHQVCAVDLNTVRTYCADYMATEATSHIGWDWLDHVMVSKGVDSTSGKRYVLLMGGPAVGVWSVNLASGKLDFEYRGGDNYEWGSNQDGYCDPNEVCISTPHADTMEDSDGKQYLVTTKGIENPCSLQLVTMDLSKGRFFFWPVSEGGGLKTVMNLANCGENWPDFDLGCAKNSPYCVLTTFRDSWRDPADLTTPFPTEPHRDRIALMHGNGAEITFLAITRTVAFLDDTYWPQPRSAVSPDGKFIAFDSNFGVDGGERVAILSTQAPLNPVQAVSVTPRALTGSVQTLTLTYSDVAGTTDLSTVSAWIRPANSSANSNSCLIQYDRSADLLKLADDSGAAWTSLTPGAANTIQNSQCSIGGAGVAVVTNPNTLVLSVALTMKPAYAGGKQVWLSATGGVGSSGWQSLGTWSVPGASSVITNTSITPGHGNSAGQTFTAVWTDTAGAADIASASLWITTGATRDGASSCYITWTRAGSQFKLFADSAASSITGSGVIQNSQCTLDLSGARAVDSGNILTLTLPVTFKPAYAGAKSIWMTAAGSSSSSALQQMGSWTVPSATLTNLTVTPSSGSGSSASFIAVWLDSAGAADIASATVSISPGGEVFAGACNITWTASANRFSLWNDSGTTALTGSGTIQNSQCSLDTTAAKASIAGSTLKLTLPVVFKSGFAGTRQIWMWAAGNSSASQPQKIGTWTVTGGNQ
jgi:hypothetical protein